MLHLTEDIVRICVRWQPVAEIIKQLCFWGHSKVCLDAEQEFKKKKPLSTSSEPKINMLMVLINCTRAYSKQKHQALRVCVFWCSAGRAVVVTLTQLHLKRFPHVPRQHSASQSFWVGLGFGWELYGCGGRTEAPWCSYVEAFSTATCALDVGIVEDKFTGQLWLHKVHLSSQKCELSLLLYEHPDTCEKSRAVTTPKFPSVYSFKMSNFSNL